MSVEGTIKLAVLGGLAVGAYYLFTHPEVIREGFGNFWAGLWGSGSPPPDYDPPEPGPETTSGTKETLIYDKEKDSNRVKIIYDPTTGTKENLIYDPSTGTTPKFIYDPFANLTGTSGVSGGQYFSIPSAQQATGQAIVGASIAQQANTINDLVTRIRTPPGLTSTHSPVTIEYHGQQVAAVESGAGLIPAAQYVNVSSPVPSPAPSPSSVTWRTITTASGNKYNAATYNPYRDI